MGASEPRLPTAVGRLAHGNLLVVDVIAVRCAARMIGINCLSCTGQRAPGELLANGVARIVDSIEAVGEGTS